MAGEAELKPEAKLEVNGGTGFQSGNEPDPYPGTEPGPDLEPDPDLIRFCALNDKTGSQATEWK